MTTLFLLNILLAVLWCFTWGVFDFYTFITGFALGYLLLGLTSRSVAFEGYAGKAWGMIRFGMYFVRVLIVANLQIAWEILTPRHNISPRIVRFDVTGLTPVQRAVMVNLINLTPGTLVVGINKDETTLYVHCMYAADRAAAINDLNYLKNRLLTEVF